MRRAFGALVVIGALAAVPVAIRAQAEQTWKGAISDSNCNAKHPAGEHEGKKMTAADCTGVCVKKGAKYVFVSEGKVFQLANQSSKQIASHAGQEIELTGTIQGNTITATRMKAAAK
jgi:Tfp pilus assembly protein PilW